MTRANAQHVRLGGLGRAWRGFDAWRRTRPFWGGLLLLLAGLEIFATTQMSLGGLSFQFGPTGFLSWLIPVIIAACGLFAWFTPGQRMFYAVVGGVAAVFSLVGVNLGGFFVGLLLGILGAGLVFAWVPSAPAPQVAAPDPATVPFAMPDEGLDLVTRAPFPAADDTPTDPGWSTDASGPAGESAATDPLGLPTDAEGAPAQTTAGPAGDAVGGGHAPQTIRAADEAAEGDSAARDADRDSPATTPSDWQPPGTGSTTDDAGTDDAHQPASDEAAAMPADGGDGHAAVPSGSGEGHAAQTVPGPVADDPGGPLPRRDAPPRLYSLVVLLALGLTAAAVVVANAPAPAWAAPCATAPVANTRAEQPTPAPSPSPSVSDQQGLVGSVADGIVGGITDILDGANATAADPAATATPTPTPPPAPTPTPTPGASGTVEPSPSGSCVTARPSASEKATAGPTTTQLPRLEAAAGQPVVAEEPSLLTGSTVTMWDLKIAGIVDLPTHSGPLRAIKFTMSRSTVDDFVLAVPQSGPPLVIKSSALTVRGDVAFYATRFVGRILGVELTLTPDSPLPEDGIPLGVPSIAFDKPEIRLAFVQCDTLEAPGLDESFPNEG